MLSFSQESIVTSLSVTNAPDCSWVLYKLEQDSAIGSDLLKIASFRQEAYEKWKASGFKSKRKKKKYLKALEEGQELLLLHHFGRLPELRNRSVELAGQWVVYDSFNTEPLNFLLPGMGQINLEQLNLLEGVWFNLSANTLDFKLYTTAIDYCLNPRVIVSSPDANYLAE